MPPQQSMRRCTACSRATRRCSPWPWPRVFNIQVPEPVPDGVTVLSTDPTETDPLERHPDSVMQAEFLVQDRAGRYILVIESQTEPDDERRRQAAANLAEFTEVGLGETPGSQIWRDLMATSTFPFVSRTRMEARAEGLGEAILEILDDREIDVDDESRARIDSCTDAGLLKRWLRRSRTVASAADLFAG